MFLNWCSRFLKSTVFLFCTVAMVAVGWSTASANANSSRGEISSLVNDLKTAWETLDLPRLEKLFDLGYDMEYYPTEMMKVGGGGEGIKAYFEDAVGHLSKVKLSVKSVKTDSFGDAAYAAFLYRFEYEWDGKPGASDGRITLVLRKKDGQWKVIHYHESVPMQ